MMKEIKQGILFTVVTMVLMGGVCAFSKARSARRRDRRLDVHRLARPFEPDQHRQIHPGDHFDKVGFHEGDSEV